MPRSTEAKNLCRVLLAPKLVVPRCSTLGGRGLARRVSPPWDAPGMHYKGRDLSGGPRSGSIGGWSTFPKRLGAFDVSYKSIEASTCRQGDSWAGPMLGTLEGGVPPTLLMHPCPPPPRPLGIIRHGMVARILLWP